MDLICTLITFARYVVIAWVILSLVANLGRLPWDHPVRRLYNWIDKPMRRVLGPIRDALPPVRMGGAMALDLSPLVLLFGLLILQIIVC